MNKKLLLPLIFSITALAGCSLTPHQQTPEDSGVPSQSAPESSSAAPLQAALESSVQATNTGSTHIPSKPISASLYAQHREWKGTRYQLGGMSKRGIDCSALTYLTVRDLLGIELPRTTGQQAQAGRAIERDELRAGDLVFFKTGRRGQHVGIYIEDGKFFHASTSKGVTISHMSEHYWKFRYWRARRLDTRPAP